MEVTISIPTTQFVAESPDRVAAKIRLYAALGLYQSGELSIGAACELGDSHRFAHVAVIPPPTWGQALRRQESTSEMDSRLRGNDSSLLDQMMTMPVNWLGLTAITFSIWHGSFPTNAS